MDADTRQPATMTASVAANADAGLSALERHAEELERQADALERQAGAMRHQAEVMQQHARDARRASEAMKRRLEEAARRGGRTDQEEEAVRAAGYGAAGGSPDADANVGEGRARP